MPQVAIGAAALGAAAVASGGLGAALAATGFIGALAQLGGSLLLSSAASALLQQKPRLQDRTLTVRAPAMPRDIVYGKVRKGGTIVYFGTGERGTFRRDLHVIIVLAAHEVEEIGAVYFNGEMAVNAAGIVQPRWAGFLWVDSRRGTADQTAFAHGGPGNPPGWTANHRLRGCAALYVKLHFNADRYPTGLPTISADVKGKCDILDPRTGQRGWTDNAALCTADYVSLERFGLNAQIGAEDGIDTDCAIEAANICDEAVPLAEGGTEKRYTCNGVISLSDPPKAILEALLSSMAGTCAWQGGAFRIHAGAYRAPTVTLGPDDIREGGISVTTRVSMRENFNAVRGQFISPENDWQPDDFPAYESQTYLNEGGEQIYKDISLPFTTSSTMAQRLAKIELERARRQMTVRMSGKLGAYRAAVGGAVALNYPRWGFSTKPFEVRGLALRAEDGAVLPELVLRETSPLVFDWSATEEQIYEAAPRTNLPSAFEIDAPGTPEVTEQLYVTRDGTGVKALARIQWQESPSVAVARYEVQARRIQTPAGVATGDPWLTRATTSETVAEIHDLEPGRWQIRIKAVSLLGVSSPWAEAARDILGLTAPPLQLTGLGIQVGGGLAVLTWQRSADLDVRIGGRILIRHSASSTPAWTNSVSVGEVAGADGMTIVPLIPGTYILRARDNSGNLGPEALIRTAGAQVLDFVPAGILIADPGFTGAKQNLQVVSNTLRLSNIAQEGVYTFAAGISFASVKRLRVRSIVEVTALNLTTTIDDRHDPIDSWLDFDGTDGADIDVIVEIRTTEDDPAGNPSWSGWFRVQSTELAARGIQARARLISRSEDFNVIVSQLRIQADEVA